MTREQVIITVVGYLCMLGIGLSFWLAGGHRQTPRRVDACRLTNRGAAATSLGGGAAPRPRPLQVDIALPLPRQYAPRIPGAHAAAPADDQPTHSCDLCQDGGLETTDQTGRCVWCGRGRPS